MALSTSNSSPGWKSYTETNDVNDIIKATDFDNEFSIKVDQDSGYSLNQNIVSGSIDNTSTLRGLKSTITIDQLVNFYLNYSVSSGSWTPLLKITSNLVANTTYTSSGSYILSNNLLYFWGEVNVTNMGIATGIISNGTMSFTEDYSATNVAQNGVTTTGGTGSGAIFNITSKNVYKVSTIVMQASGTGYSENDVLTITDTATVVVLTTTEQGSITDETYTIDSTPREYNISGSYTPTGGTGSGATFNVNASSETLYTPETITLNDAGSGYAVNDTITLVNIGVVTVETVDSNGGILSVSIVLSTVEQTTNMSSIAVSGQTSGSGVNATFTVTSKSGTYYVPSSISLTAEGVNYSLNDELLIKSSSGDNIAEVYVKSITTSGEILTYSISPNTSYQDSDVSGNNISASGGTGSGVTFNVTTNQYYTYDKAIISNGGTNYVIGDVLTVDSNIGSYTVTNISSSDGSVIISGLPESPVANSQFPVDVLYFDGSDNVLYSSIQNNYIDLYQDQKNTSLSTANINSSFQFNFSGWFPINNS